MQQTLTADHTLVRETNLTAVLNLLREKEPVSRAQLAAMTGLNKSTVSILIKELIDRRLVAETGMATSGTGRPGTSLAMDPRAGLMIGVEIGVGFISVIVANILGQPVWRAQEETQPGAGQEKVLEQAYRILDTAMEENRSSGLRFLGVGVTLPGIVDIKTGSLVFSPNLSWRDVPLAAMFSQRTGLTVVVDNDANAATYGEHLFGAARQVRNFIFILAGVGVGGGLFLNGDLYRGAGGFAGEVGHTTSTLDTGRPCRCGNRGCWETFINQYSLVERTRLRLALGQDSRIPRIKSEQSTNTTLAVLSQAAEEGDSVTMECLNETGTAIGTGIANLINIFNPELVIFGGAMSILGRFLMPSIEAAVEEHALAETRKQARIELSAFGTDAGVMGAAALVIKSVLANPARVAKDA